MVWKVTPSRDVQKCMQPLYTVERNPVQQNCCWPHESEISWQHEYHPISGRDNLQGR